MKFEEMYIINRRFRPGYGGMYTPKYLDEAIADRNLLYALNIAHNNIEILLRYIYLYGKVATQLTVTEKEVKKTDSPLFKRLCDECKQLIGEKLYNQIISFNKVRTIIHTVIVNRQLESDEEMYYNEIQKTKKYCEELFSILFRIMEDKDKTADRL